MNPTFVPTRWLTIFSALALSAVFSTANAAAPTADLVMRYDAPASSTLDWQRDGRVG